MQVRRSDSFSPLFAKAIDELADPNKQDPEQPDTSYRIQHKPMSPERGGAKLHDLTPAFGEDIYGPNALQFFGSGDPRERHVLDLLWSLRGKPNAIITIYRRVPQEAQNQINPGDWVTLDKNVANDFVSFEKGKVVSKKVPASHVTSWADSLLEFGYFP